MKLLLDTHVLLWWWSEKARLKSDVRQAIATSDDVLVSSASAWEVAIKQTIGRLRLPASFPLMVDRSHFTELPVTFRHTDELARLPGHHRDPFDRILIAQAKAEGATVVTHDRQFEPYGMPVMWV